MSDLKVRNEDGDVVTEVSEGDAFCVECRDTLSSWSKILLSLKVHYHVKRNHSSLLELDTESFLHNDRGVWVICRPWDVEYGAE